MFGQTIQTKIFQFREVAVGYFEIFESQNYTNRQTNVTSTIFLKRLISYAGTCDCTLSVGTKN